MEGHTIDNYYMYLYKLIMNHIVSGYIQLQLARAYITQE